MFEKNSLKSSTLFCEQKALEDSELPAKDFLFFAESVLSRFW